ncbi:hypothetical protein TrLO_g4669 [Triparma laevis f. longispina]|uniref:C2 domain-containing protein n=1 Tax=Triparma laevis f. longispina TaxID=1714387 RepID=A0A9W7CEK7_9STRA|nr:hypothetical protein TrLO_g4669 [Triparma laevis f. longispina]
MSFAPSESSPSSSDASSSISRGRTRASGHRRIKSDLNSHPPSEAVQFLITSPSIPCSTPSSAITLLQSCLTSSLITRHSSRLQPKRSHLKHIKPKIVFEDDSSLYGVNLVKVLEWKVEIKVGGIEEVERRDYYVKVGIGDESHNSKVQMRTTSPTFNEIFTFGVTSVPSSQLKIHLYSYDPILSDSLIASGRISLKNFTTGKITLSTPKSTFHSSLSLQITSLKNITTPHTSSQPIPLKIHCYIYESCDVSNGHLAAIDMKIGSGLGLQWWNRVSLVHQKALYDLNERAVSAVSIPTKLVPVFGEGVKVVIPRPEGAGWGDEEIFEDVRIERTVQINGDSNDDTLFHPGSRFSLSKIPFIGSLFMNVKTLVKPPKPHKPSPSNSTTKKLTPKILPLSTLAAVGQNRLISNGSLKLIIWITVPPLSPMGPPLPEPPSPLQTIDFPLPLSNSLIDEIVPFGYKRVRRALLCKESKFMKEHWERRGVKDVEEGEWRFMKGEEEEIGEDVQIGSPEYNVDIPDSLTGKSHALRTISYTMPKTSIVKANKVTEYWKLTFHSTSGFIVEVSTLTPHVPFGSSFTTNVLYCIEKRSVESTWVSISSCVKFKGKRPFIAGQIEGGEGDGREF